jgi:hypothetical protein
MNLRKNTQTKIIGIIDDERQAKIGEPSQPEVEICLRQLTPDSGFYQPSTVAMDLAVRTERAPDSIIPELRSILGQANRRGGVAAVLSGIVRAAEVYSDAANTRDGRAHCARSAA